MNGITLKRVSRVVAGNGQETSHGFIRVYLRSSVFQRLPTSGGERPAGGLHELAAEHERVGDLRDRLDRAAGAGDVDRAEVEHAAPEALVHATRLDFLEVDLDGVAL